MKYRKEYLEMLLKKHSPKALHNTFFIDEKITTTDGINLDYTEIKTRSNIGVVIVPGLTIPRESYYTLLNSLSEYNVILFDLRGQAFSGGEMDVSRCIQDINYIGQKFKEKYNLKFLIGIGHSFGGLTLLRASLENNHPYNLRIALAATIDMTKIVKKVPELASILIIYLYNLYRALKLPVFRNEIVKYYQSFGIFSFIKDPRIISLKIRNSYSFNNIRLQAPKLTDFISKIARPSYLIYPRNDTRLKIKGKVKLKSEYENLFDLASQKGIQVVLLENLSHSFNLGIEKELLFSYNNDMVIQKIKEIIESYKYKHEQKS